MDCYEECYNTEGCHYFSLGGANLEHEAWVGVCMGCTEDAVLSNHAGFNAFEMEMIIQLVNILHLERVPVLIMLIKVYA